MSEAPEQDRLLARLNESRVVSAHVSWGPEAENLTPEQRAAAINNIMDQAEEQDRDRVSVRRADLRIVYEAMKRAIRLGQSTVDEYLAASPEVRALRSAIFLALDVPLLHAAQMLPDADRREIRDMVATDQRAERKEST